MIIKPVRVHKRFWDMIKNGDKQVDFRRAQGKLMELFTDYGVSSEFKVVFRDLNNNALGEVKARAELHDISDILASVTNNVTGLGNQLQHVWFMFNKRNGYFNDLVAGGQYVQIIFQSEVKVYSEPGVKLMHASEITPEGVA